MREREREHSSGNAGVETQDISIERSMKTEIVGGMGLVNLKKRAGIGIYHTQLVCM